MLHLSVPTNQQGSQDAVNDPRCLLFPFLSRISLAGGGGGQQGVLQ